MDQMTPLISSTEIARAVERLAAEIDDSIGGTSFVVIGVLKGSFIFLSDLVRRMHTPSGVSNSFGSRAMAHRRLVQEARR